MKFEIFVGVACLVLILSIALLEFVNRGSGRYAHATTTEEPAPKRGDGRTED